MRLQRINPQVSKETRSSIAAAAVVFPASSYAVRSVTFLTDCQISFRKYIPMSLNCVCARTRLMISFELIEMV